jgi:hypothetical protein
LANLDGANLTMILALRPGPGGDPETSTPTAGLVVTFDPGPALTDKLLRALLSKGWELVAAPLGQFDPASSTYLAHVECSDASAIAITSGSEVIYSNDALGSRPPYGWVELAQVRGVALVYLAVSPDPLTTEDDMTRAARAGHVVGGYATLDMEPAWSQTLQP